MFVCSRWQSAHEIHCAECLEYRDNGFIGVIVLHLWEITLTFYEGMVSLGACRIIVVIISLSIFVFHTHTFIKG